jgi:FixJ family two-component response regulator
MIFSVPGRVRFMKDINFAEIPPEKIGYKLFTKWQISISSDIMLNRRPCGITFNSQGELYVIDSKNHCVFKYDSSGNFITYFGFKGCCEGGFDSPARIAIDKLDNIYITETGNVRIQKFSKEHAFRVIWGKYGSLDGDVKSPRGIGIVDEEFIYIADSHKNRVVIFDYASYKFIKSFGNDRLNCPDGIAVDSTKNIYIASSGNNTIEKFDKNGNFILKLDCMNTFHRKFNNPVDVAVDIYGYVYIADRDNSRIMKFDGNGNFITSFGENITPAGVAVDRLCNVYVACSDGYIYKYLPYLNENKDIFDAKILEGYYEINKKTLEELKGRLTIDKQEIMILMENDIIQGKELLEKLTRLNFDKNEISLIFNITLSKPPVSGTILHSIFHRKRTSAVINIITGKEKEAEKKVLPLSDSKPVTPEKFLNKEEKKENNVLIVDDEINVLNSLKRLMIDDHFNVLTASSGEEAINIIKDNKNISVIISDMRMPGITGVDLLEMARDVLPFAGRIILTGYADVKNAIDAINRGGAGNYIVKPWNDEELLEVIRNAVKKYEDIKKERKNMEMTQKQMEQLKEWNLRLGRLVKEKAQEINELKNK